MLRQRSGSDFSQVHERRPPVAEMVRAATALTAERAFSARLVDLGFERTGAQGEALRARLARDLTKWRDIVQQISLKPE